MTTNPDLDQAREWARTAINTPNNFPKGRAAAEVINALPDEWIDADKLREVIGRWDVLLADDDHEDMHGMLDDLRALFPAPQPRTLADMTPEEREACQWSLVETPENEGAFIKQHGNEAMVIYPSGRHIFWDLDVVVPMLDMPRLEWPGHHPATEEDVSIIPPKIDTSTGHDDDVDMAPEDAPDGYYLVRWWGEEHPVPAEKVQGQWWVIGKPTMLPAKDVLIVSRLVPEVKV